MRDKFTNRVGGVRWMGYMCLMGVLTGLTKCLHDRSSPGMADHDVRSCHVLLQRRLETVPSAIEGCLLSEAWNERMNERTPLAEKDRSRR